MGESTVRPLDVMAKLLFPKWTFEEGEADLTVLRVVAEGIENGQPTRYAWDLLDRFDPETGLRSMSRTTAFPAAIMAGLILDGSFRRPGVFAPEAVGREAGPPRPRARRSSRPAGSSAAPTSSSRSRRRSPEREAMATTRLRQRAPRGPGHRGPDPPRALLHRPRALPPRAPGRPLRHVALRGPHRAAPRDTGRFFLVRFAGVNVIVLRDDKGEIAAFHNTCRHRGTLLCKEDAGQLAGRIQCSYHAWTYGLDGRLLKAPLMEKVVGFREEEHPLGRVATAVWDGHVFINLSEKPLPFEEHLAGLDRKFAPWGMADLRRVRAQGLPPEGQLEARHPELFRVHPLPDRPPAAQQALALPERGQRAAPADLPRRPHGPARGGGDALRRRPEGPRLPARASRRSRAGRSTTTRSCPTSS